MLEGRHDIDQNLESGVSGPLRIAGQEFEHGIHVYAQCKIRIPVPGKQERFEAWVGIDDWVGEPRCRTFPCDRSVGCQAAWICGQSWRCEFSDERSRREMKRERRGPDSAGGLATG